jgi:xanthine dehydrogenase YagS FAD-binding subunit
MATVGGNLMQRTRCRYFQDVDAPCNKRAPGSGCPAIAGEHHNLAIFGISEHCIASHPSDMAVALAALDATVVVRSRTAERQVRFDQFYRDPGDRPELDTTIEPGELITAVCLPSPLPGRVAYRKVRERTSFAFALVSLAAVLDLHDDHTVGGVRLALGGVAHRPWRATRAEQALLGARADATNFRAAIDRELESATPLAHNAYKVPLARNLVVSTLEALAVDREPGGEQ